MSISGVRFHFSEEQRKVLKSYYHEQGIRSVSKKNSGIIEQIAAEIQATTEQVKHWINAERSRESKRQSASCCVQDDSQTPSHSQESTIMVRVQKPHKRSGFNMFCSSQSGSVVGEGRDVLQELSRRWSLLSEGEKTSWNQRAKDVSSYSDQQRKKVIKDIIGTTEQNFKILSQLGVEAYGVILNQVTSDCKVICSSETVREFVSAEDERGQGVDHNFFRYMCGASYMYLQKGGRKRKRDMCSYDEMLGNIRTDWNQKYRAVCGEGRIPYSDPGRMKCVMVGLPAGVSFQQPAKYTAVELRQIHGSLDKIQFLPLSTQDSGDVVGCEEDATPPSDT